MSPSSTVQDAPFPKPAPLAPPSSHIDRVFIQQLSSARPVSSLCRLLRQFFQSALSNLLQAPRLEQHISALRQLSKEQILRYFLVPSFFSAILLGSFISVINSNDSNWREHLVIWGVFGLLAVLAVFVYFYVNRGLIERYMKNPNETHLIFEILFGKKNKKE